jgi:hypothetical protein
VTTALLLSGSDCENKGGDCDSLPQIYVGTPSWDGVNANCKTTNTEWCELNERITGYKTWGTKDIPVQVVNGSPVIDATANTKRIDGMCPGETQDDLVIDSGTDDTPITGDSDGATWHASSYEISGIPGEDPGVTFENADMATFDDCALNSDLHEECYQSNSCSGTYNTYISHKPASDNCGDYEDITIRVLTETDSVEDMSGDLRYAIDSDCVSGAGRFQLAPMWTYDRDGDGDYSAIFLPMQESGTGVMTNSAWITEAELFSGVSGKPLRIVKSDQVVAFDLSDEMEDKTTGTTVVSGTHNYNTGNYGGNAYFIAEELSLTELDNFEVDLTWSCATGQNGMDLGQGWQLRASDIGCSDYIQKLTLRYFTGPNRVEVQQYGNPNFTLVQPTTTTATGEAFIFEDWGLTIDATLTSWSSSGATIQIDEISLAVVNICTTGTYNLAPE